MHKQHLSPQQLQDANSLLKVPFNFFGCYLTLSTEQQQELQLFKPVKRRYLEAIAENNVELDEAKVMIESMTAVVETLTEKAKRDAIMIEALDKEMKLLRLLMEQEKSRFKEIQENMYFKMRRMHEDTLVEFANYRTLSQIEHDTNETIIIKQAQMLETMF